MGQGEGLGGAAVSPVPVAAAAPGPASCLLLDLEKKPLLKVFVFLNAGEVLRAAQVCRPMFRKVRVCLRSGLGVKRVAELRFQGCTVADTKEGQERP